MEGRHIIQMTDSIWFTPVHTALAGAIVFENNDNHKNKAFCWGKISIPWYCKDQIIGFRWCKSEGRKTTLKPFPWLISYSSFFSEARFLHKTISQTFTLLYKWVWVASGHNDSPSSCPKAYLQNMAFALQKAMPVYGLCLCCWLSQGAGFSLLLLWAVIKHKDKSMERQAPGLAADSAPSKPTDWVWWFTWEA